MCTTQKYNDRANHARPTSQTVKRGAEAVPPTDERPDLPILSVPASVLAKSEEIGAILDLLTEEPKSLLTPRTTLLAIEEAYQLGAASQPERAIRLHLSNERPDGERSDIELTYAALAFYQRQCIDATTEQGLGEMVTLDELREQIMGRIIELATSTR